MIKNNLAIRNRNSTIFSKEKTVDIDTRFCIYRVREREREREKEKLFDKVKKPDFLYIRIYIHLLPLTQWRRLHIYRLYNMNNKYMNCIIHNHTYNTCINIHIYDSYKTNHACTTCNTC